MAETTTDCRTPAGVIVGLIDGIIAASRVVAPYLRETVAGDAVLEALKDLRADEDVARVLTAKGSSDGV